MEDISLDATHNTPAVNFNHKSGMLEISGRSIPEHANMFYRPIIDWLKEYVSAQPADTKLNVKLDYINSSSHKFLLEIFEKLEPLQQNSCNVVINWHYEEDDEEMKETGEEFGEIINVPVKIIEVEEF